MSIIDTILEVKLVDALFYWVILVGVVVLAVSFLTKRRGISNYNNKHVLITGGSAGLGKSLAIKLARQGAHITIVARNEQKLKEAQAEIENAKSNTNQKIFSISADVSSKKDVQRAIETATKTNGEIDVLIANAGYSHPCYFADTPVEEFERELQVNYMGVLYTIKSVLPTMTQRRQGHIVIVSSAITFAPIIGYANYCATKCALKGLADSLRNELLLYNIGVSIYCPANIDTEGFKEEQKIKPPETKEIEGAATLLTPDYAADCLLNGLKKGHYVILSEFFPSDFMRAVVHPVFIPRNSVLFDAIIAPIFVVVGGFILSWADGVVKAAGKKLPTTKKQN